MGRNLIEKGLTVLLKRQTNILSAAFIIMVTVVLSQLLGLVRQRLLVAIFGASNTLGIYEYASLLPDVIFQVTIAAALSSAFIPVFSDYLGKGRQEEAHKMASTVLSIGLLLFFVLSLILSIFAPFFLQIFNMGSEFSIAQMVLMSNLMRIILIGQIFFIIGSFITALLQSYNQFFIPGIAAATYNLGIVVGVWFLSPYVGIYSVPFGVILGALIYVLLQIPLALRVGFSFVPSFSNIRSESTKRILVLMGPRTLSIIVFQIGTLLIASLISYLQDPGRMNVIFNFAKTLAFAPVVLFGQAMAQAAFPVLSREKEKPEEFKATFMTSFSQLLYIVLPISVLFLVLRIPIVRLVYGVGLFDWEATVLTGRTLAWFSISIFAQALIYLVSRGFYALQDTKTPLIVGVLSTLGMIGAGSIFVLYYGLGVESIAIAYSFANILNLTLLMIILDRKTGGFERIALISSWTKIFIATLFTSFALYVPIRLLDELVIDTTRTVGLILLTGISSFAGLTLYLFLTWLFDVKEAITFIHIFKKLGNWREILTKNEEVISPTRLNP